eukprot:TRINITY_DN10001_c0_g1_i2.p1 TRINITY_DN10001_c0_g1~~TRINITY_DN10001_c0_g1_i2.p1  ORF type:complete len:448 (+),score=111.07 TRINITY_DN10001_c0_g1_i2:60-1346(+)
MPSGRAGESRRGASTGPRRGDSDRGRSDRQRRDGRGDRRPGPNLINPAQLREQVRHARIVDGIGEKLSLEQIAKRLPRACPRKVSDKCPNDPECPHGTHNDDVVYVQRLLQSNYEIHPDAEWIRYSDQAQGRERTRRRSSDPSTSADEPSARRRRIDRRQEQPAASRIDRRRRPSEQGRRGGARRERDEAEEGTDDERSVEELEEEEEEEEEEETDEEDEPDHRPRGAARSDLPDDGGSDAGSDEADRQRPPAAGAARAPAREAKLRRTLLSSMAGRDRGKRPASLAGDPPIPLNGVTVTARARPTTDGLDRIKTAVGTACNDLPPPLRRRVREALCSLCADRIALQPCHVAQHALRVAEASGGDAASLAHWLSTDSAVQRAIKVVARTTGGRSPEPPPSPLRCPHCTRGFAPHCSATGQPHRWTLGS